MKTFVGALALGASLSMLPAAQAQDCGGCEAQQAAGPVGPAVVAVADDDDEKKLISEVEARLNEVLLVDETGGIVLRNEFKEGLPFPPQRLQQMLQSFVELGEDGKVHLKNPAAIRPYLPMIRGFLSQGGMERLKKLRDLPPEQRRDAMRRLFGEGATPLPFGPGPRGERGERDDDDRPRPRAQPRQRPNRPEQARPRQGRAGGDRAPQGRRAAARGGSVEDRLDRIERSVQRIEKMMQHMAQMHADRLEGHGGAQGHGRRTGPGLGHHDGSGLGSNRRHDGSGMGQRRNRRGGDRAMGPGRLLERLRGLLRNRRDDDGGPRWGGNRDGARPGPGEFFRRFFNRDREDDDRDGDRDDDRGRGRRGLRSLNLDQLMQRGGVWRDGIGKLRELSEPSDMEALRKLLDGFDPREGMDMGKLMQRAQEKLSPEETARLMEVFSEFLATPEGRAMAKELEGMVGRMEDFMHSPEGARTMERLQKLGERFGRDSGGLEKLQDLIRGRQKKEREPRARQRSSAQERHHGKTAPRNPKAKLY